MPFCLTKCLIHAVSGLWIQRCDLVVWFGGLVHQQLLVGSCSHHLRARGCHSWRQYEAASHFVTDCALELNLLLAVKLCSTLPKITCLNHGCLLVTLVHSLDQVSIQVLYLFLQRGLALNPTQSGHDQIVCGIPYLLEFMRAEKGRAEMLSSMGRLTDGMGMFEMPLSYSLLFKSFFLDLSGTKLLRSIYKEA